MNMKISDLGEFGLIDRIRRTASRSAKGAPISIGDDAAALLLSPSSVLLATTDMLIEGIHFDLKTTDLYSLGWKAAAVNLSDIAAMGGVPRFCLTSLGIPSSLTVEQVDDFYRGFSECVRKERTVLVGGDTCGSQKGLIISVTVLGEGEKDHLVTRSGAKPGDLLYVTGTLGDSGAGLEMLRAGAGSRTPGARRLIEKHLRPVPHVAEGRKLALSGVASTMIDVSDGLSSDLGHICEQSAMGAEIFEERIPLSRQLRSAKGLKRPPVEYALSGGEDYELLFTVSPAKIKKLKALRIRATEIGVITRERSMLLLNDRRQGTPLMVTGYNHFRSGRRRGSNR